MKSLQTKLLVFVFVALIVFGIVLGVVSHVSMHEVIDDDSDRILVEHCNHEKETVNNTLESLEQSVNIVADIVSEEFEGLSVLESKEKYQDFSNFVADVFSKISTHTENVYTYYFRYNYLLTDTRAGFYKAITDSGVIDYEPLDILQYSIDDIANTGWYYRPLEAKKAVWIEPYICQLGTELITYSVSIYYGDTFIAVVGMEIEFELITNAVKGMDVYGVGQAYLVDDNDSIIYHETLSKGSLKPSITSTYTEAEAVLSNGMTLVLGVEREVITEESHSVLHNLIYTIAIFIVVAMIGMYIITKSIIHPLRELTEAAKKVENGNFDIELYHPSLDEVGILSRSFQKTVDVLNDKMEFINKLAYTDSLTGLFNNTAYTDHTIQLERNIHEKKFALIIFDVNDLKKINDEYGHERGNELIIKAAQYIKTSFKNSNTYRIGGDEFAVILEGDDLKQCDELLEKFDENLVDQTITIGSGKLKINIARGMAIYSMANDYKVDDVFKRADKAMYQNKKELKSHKKM